MRRHDLRGIRRIDPLNQQAFSWFTGNDDRCLAMKHAIGCIESQVRFPGCPCRSVTVKAFVSQDRANVSIERYDRFGRIGDETDIRIRQVQSNQCRQPDQSRLCACVLDLSHVLVLTSSKSTMTHQSLGFNLFLGTYPVIPILPAEELRCRIRVSYRCQPHSIVIQIKISTFEGTS